MKGPIDVVTIILDENPDDLMRLAEEADEFIWD